MFNSKNTFAMWFEPVNGGYLYYPKAGVGGKLVTAEEYDRLVAGWERAVGTRAAWAGAGLVFLVLVLWILLSEALSLPKWTDWIVLVACFVGIIVRIFWAAFAPVRLVKNRPDFAPPRPASEMQRKARDSVKWPLVVCVLVFSAAIFVSHLISGDRTPIAWAWLVGSGLFFITYLRIAILKMLDRRS